MKKALALLSVLALILTGTTAFAQSTVTGSFTLDSRSVELNPLTNTLAVWKDDPGCYVLMNAAGRELTTRAYLKMDDNNEFYEVAVEDGLNNIGLIDSEGAEVLPMAYADIEYLSDRWQVGVVLEPATVENYDYKSFGGDSFYLVTSYDFYYQGAKVGTLSRTAYHSATAYGAYLYVRDKEGNYAYYDSSFVQSSYTGDGYNSEYEEHYQDHSIWHRGSNQQAFTAGCTLTPEDVSVSIYAINNQFFDLQGNLLFTAANPYDSIRKFQGDYALVKAYGKYGLIDRNGTEVVPCQYDEINCYDRYFGAGYQVAVRDGKVGFVDLNGRETTEFKYGSSNAHSSYSPFTDLKDMENNIIVISGAIGELPEKYEEVSYARSKDSCPILLVKKDGKAGAIDLYGNEVVALNGDYDSSYDLSVSNDGTLIVGYLGSRQYRVYNLEHSAEAAAPTPASETAQPDASAEPEQTGWTCPGCETENSGNFCTSCGTARPEEGVSCGKCGYVPEGETPNFCPNCGTKMGE